MTLYWLYDVPSWLFAAIVIVFFRIHQVDHSHNDIVGYFLAALTVFYGITLGLVAVGTWSTFSAVRDNVDGEAQLVAQLRRRGTAAPTFGGRGLLTGITSAASN